MKNIIRLVFRLKNVALRRSFILVFFLLPLQLNTQRMEALYAPWLRLRIVILCQFHSINVFKWLSVSEKPQNLEIWR